MRARVQLTLRSRLAVSFAAVFALAGAAVIAVIVVLAGQSIDHANAANGPALADLKRAISSIVDGTRPTASTPASAAPSPAPSPSPSVAAPSPGPSKSADVAAALAKARLLAANHAYTKATGSSARRHLITWALIAAAVLAPAAGVAGWLLAGRALRPLRDVTAAVQRVSASQLSERLAMTGPADEITDLAGTFDAMMDRLEHAFDAQRRFVADASHELRTPLSIATTAVDVVLARPGHTAGELEAMAGDVRVALARAERTVAALLTLTQAHHLDHRRESVDLATVAGDAIDEHRALLGPLTVHAELDSTLVVGDAALLERLAAILVDNAARHNVAGGEAGVHTARRDGTATLTVTNTGPVVPVELVPQLFAPFHRLDGRARSADGGLGLGLTIAHTIAAAHGADLTATAPPSGGLIVEVSFPSAADSER